MTAFKWCSVSEVAHAMKRQRATVYNWVRRGLVIIRREPGGRIDIQCDSEGRALASHGQPHTHLVSDG